MNEELLKEKFIGCMLGTHTGDALGMPVEGWTAKAIKDRYGEVREMLEARMGAGSYTDDTEMMIAVAESIIRCNGFDGQDMARSFVENFNPQRGYGRGCHKVIQLLRDGLSWKEAGKDIFPGGSLGNGAAMRIAPIAAFYYNDPQKLKEIACKTSMITHTHPLGKQGAALQAYAISRVICREAGKSLDVELYIKELIEFLKPEGEVYIEKLNVIEKLLPYKSDKEKIASVLGNNSTAPNSVPVAIFSFLSHHESFEDAVVYAVSLGGDTDTIGAMTGAISGGFYGRKAIPERWVSKLENTPKGKDYIESLAVKLWKLKKQ